MKVRQFPLAKITPWFTAGIAFAFYGKANAIFVFWCLLAASLVLLATWVLARRTLAQRPYFGIATLVFSFALGAAVFVAHDETLNPKHFIHHTDDAPHTLALVLRERLKNTPAQQRYVAHLTHIDGKPVTGKVLLQLPLVHFRRALPVGTVLQTKAALLAHKKPKNPDQFDYGAYLAQRSILAQVYADAHTLKIRKQPVKDIFCYADRVRSTIVQNLEKSGCAALELSVIAALLLGQQQEIDSETVRDYQLAGAVHILSVSGLHVGLLMVFLNALLRLLPNTKSMRRFKLVLVLVCLWGFAVVAGLSPSVVRSVTMFSFMAVGMHLKRKTNIFHTLLVSALLILVCRPSFLFDIGFQLSYAALFFILWLQPMLDDWWQPKNRVARYFWQILTVSFAAQIGTMPLSIYYFHQFPGLFFVTNLIVIPLLSIIMALGILAMVPAIFGVVPDLLAQALTASVRILNEIIGWIASFEQFVLTDIPLNRAMMIALYALIVAAVLWLERPNFAKATLALTLVLIFQSVVLLTRMHTQTQRQWLVFDVYKNTGIVAHDGSRLTIYGSSDFAEGRAVQTYATAHFATIVATLPIKNTVYFEGNEIAIIDSANVIPPTIQPDVLLLRQSPKQNLDRLLQTVQPKIVVADASNYKSYVDRWKATCKKYKIPFHATAEKGFFKL
ncbi:ComEC/Rec2 family competence protein [Flavobacterium caeni]|uniref:Competence protein ComEC n=1 Tax=Flavobacterium caeni TaxID=490189 RepID=A0A1G5GLR4_9FLAO|nr:ComEC/Rec2 family competence protein [Flavobacterium caeni]SCY51628.1 competence protein ComEC [Flavobacterium caeni]